MVIEVTSGAIATMLDEMARCAPEEACGLLLGPAGGRRIARARAAANVAQDRTFRFEIDPQALIDAHRAQRSGGPALIGYYHSHPGGGASPSATDCAMASGDGRVWAIITAGRVTFWRDTPEGFEPLSYAVVDG